MTEDKHCASCGDPIEESRPYIYHQRLRSYVHFDPDSTCPANVHGEDITMHAVYFHFPRPIADAS